MMLGRRGWLLEARYYDGDPTNCQVFTEHNESSGDCRQAFRAKVAEWTTLQYGIGRAVMKGPDGEEIELHP